MAEVKEKPKTVTANHFLKILYYEDIRERIKTLIDLVMGSSTVVNLQFNTLGDSTYIRVDGKKKDRLRIVIGGQLIKEMADMPRTLSINRAVKSLCVNIYKSFYGSANHELGHAKFTDMASREIIEYPRPKYRNFMHEVFNILEDIVIERNMVLYYQKNLPFHINPKVYFKHIVKKLFEEKADAYRDDGTQIGFLNYLLFYMRIGPKKIPTERCEIFNKYEDQLRPFIKKVLEELNPTKRIHECVVFCEWMIENIKEFDWTSFDITPSEILTGKETSAVAATAIEGAEMPKKQKRAVEVAEDGGTDEEENDDINEEEEEEEDEEEEEEEEEDEMSVEDDFDPSLLENVFNDVLHDGSDHEWSIAKEDFEPNGTVVDWFNSIVENNIDAIKEVSDYLTFFKGQIKPVWMNGMTAGRLDVRRAVMEEIHSTGNTRLFQRKLPRGIDKDACLYEVVDLSGSMAGQKSAIAAEATVILSQACEWSGIPFEVSGFVKTYDGPSGISYTIVEKGFDDTLESSKPFFGINNQQILYKNITKINPDVPTFAGNSEEVNLYYIWQKFKKVNHKTKVMFVLCDGMTTGSRSDLRDVVTKMEEEDNIFVIGIGILCQDVVNIYKHAKVFKSMNELKEGLAPYLIETLSSFVS
jgi:hypothetical protein